MLPNCMEILWKLAKTFQRSESVFFFAFTLFLQLKLTVFNFNFKLHFLSHDYAKFNLLLAFQPRSHIKLNAPECTSIFMYIRFYQKPIICAPSFISISKLIDDWRWLDDWTPRGNCLPISAHYLEEERGLHHHDEVAKRWYWLVLKFIHWICQNWSNTPLHPCSQPTSLGHCKDKAFPLYCLENLLGFLGGTGPSLSRPLWTVPSWLPWSQPSFFI